jgi:hypothetical protein
MPAVHLFNAQQVKWDKLQRHVSGVLLCNGVILSQGDWLLQTKNPKLTKPGSNQ